MQDANIDLPLEGVRVLDFSIMLAGPIARGCLPMSAPK